MAYKAVDSCLTTQWPQAAVADVEPASQLKKILGAVQEGADQEGADQAVVKIETEGNLYFKKNIALLF
jgi:hypothetical protein